MVTMVTMVTTVWTVSSTCRSGGAKRGSHLELRPSRDRRVPTSHARSLRALLHGRVAGLVHLARRGEDLR